MFGYTNSLFNHHIGNRLKREGIAHKLESRSINDNLDDIITEIDNEILRLESIELPTKQNDYRTNDDYSRIKHSRHHLQVAIDRNLESQKQAAIDSLFDGLEVE